MVWLKSRLLDAVVEVEQQASEGDVRADAILTIRTSHSSNRVFVELRKEVTPKSVAELTGGPFRRMRSAIYDMPVLVVAPFLSRQAREALRAEDLCYLDLTGNALIRLKSPAVYIETEGAKKSPTRRPLGTQRAGLRGGHAARVIRTLVDVRPPYSVTELAQSTAIDAGNVSRILAALHDFGVIYRGHRGQVAEVDIKGTLDLWAENYSLMKTNKRSLFIAKGSLRSEFENLRDQASLLVTGSFAAPEETRVAAPMQLVMYARDIATTSKELGLLPSEEGANVVLLEAFDPVVWERSRLESDVRCAAISQVAIDCLTGSGRMPSEGASIVQWMLSRENQWRLASLELRQTRGS